MKISRPAWVRSLPFVVFLAFLFVRQLAVEWPDLPFDPRWFYPFKTVLVAGLLLYFLREYGELRILPGNPVWLWLWAPLVGVAVFVLWINLDGGWINLSDGTGWVYDPRDPATGEMLWIFAIPRLLGSALLVPVMEELFWRSFLMRWIDRHDFLSVMPGAVTFKAVLFSSLLFGIEHSLWFAGILAGLAYAWLYRASGSLWPPIIAHAVTNGILGLWVLQTGSWDFW